MVLSPQNYRVRSIGTPLRIDVGKRHYKMYNDDILKQLIKLNIPMVMANLRDALSVIISF